MRLHQLFENRDGSLCPVRTFGVGFALITTAVYFGLACWTVIRDRQPLDYAAFAGGASAIWAVVAAAIVGKAHAER